MNSLNWFFRLSAILALVALAPLAAHAQTRELRAVGRA